MKRTIMASLLVGLGHVASPPAEPDAAGRRGFRRLRLPSLAPGATISPDRLRVPSHMRTELAINGSTDATARYLTWTPVPCQVRLADSTGATGTGASINRRRPKVFSQDLMGVADPNDPTGRVRFGGSIRDPTTAAKDPLFFLLHCNVDRLWAKWQ
jgi:hypothetical protein